jgi:hypothetical protein
MRKAMVAAVAVAVIGPIAHELSAQESEATIAQLRPGTRVRVVVRTWRDDRIVGTVTSSSIDGVILDTVDVAAQHRLFMPSAVVVEGYRRVGLSSAVIRRIEVSEGKSKLRGAIKIGTKAMLFSGIALGCSAISGPMAQRRDFMKGVVIGGVTGLVIGAPIGYRIGDERWRRVREKSPSPPSHIASSSARAP